MNKVARRFESSSHNHTPLAKPLCLDHQNSGPGKFKLIAVGIVISIVSFFYHQSFVVNRRKSQGKTILLEITKRYFVACLNSIMGYETNKLKNEESDKTQILQIAKGIDKVR